MATSYSTLLKLALPTQGELSGSWGDVVNNNITSMIEEAVAGLKTIDTWSGNSATLSTANGTTAESRAAILSLTDTTSDLSGAATLICPTLTKVFIVKNSTGEVVTVKTASGSGIAIANGNTSIVFCDGTNVVEAVTGITGNLAVGGNLTVAGNATVTGTTTFNGGTLTLGDSAADNVVFGADVNSSIIPNTDATFDLGSASQEWRDIYIDGTAHIDSINLNGTVITATAAEINILDDVTATTAELNYNDTGAVVGTVVASKTVTVDANKDVASFRNITLTGELDAGSLDISGDADIDGTLEADAITIGGVTLAETISDTVGAMVSGNTETNITVTYDDADNTLDFVVGTLNQSTTGSAATLTTARTIGGTSFDGSANIAVGLAATATALATARTIGGTSFDGTANIAVALAAAATILETARTIHGVSFDGSANIDLSEVISDTVGAMVSSNTETGITVTYQDGDNTIDFEIGAGAIVNSMLADDAVGADELAADAVVTASIVDGNVTTAKIAADAVTGAKIADDAINSEHYTDGSIDTAHIADLQVTTAKIAADAITEAKIADNAVESEHLNDNVISGQTELASGIADTDELLISDAGTVKRVDASVFKTYIGAADDATALAIALG